MIAAGASAGEVRHRVAVAVCVAALLAPFVDRPLHVDDPVTVWVARQIVAHPADFYGFDANWHGRLAPLSEQMQNPPLSGYLAAAITATLGGSERALHLGFLIPAIAAALGIHAIARRLCGDALLATAIAVLAPAFVVTAANLSSDVPMLACFCWAIALWLRGLDSGRAGLLACAALLAAAAALSKYFGAALLPLLAAYTVARERRASGKLLWLALPLVALVGYDAWTRAAYGHGLLLGAGSYALEQRNAGAGLAPRDLLAGLAFLGGGTAPAAFFAHRLWPPRVLAAGALAAAALTLAFGASGALGDRATHASAAGAFAFALQASVLVLAGGSVLALALLDLRARRDADALLLALLVGGTFVFATALNWTVSARSLIGVVPVVGVLVVRRLEERARTQGDGAPRGGWRRLAPLAPAAALAFALLYADARLATTNRDVAIALAQRHGSAAAPLRFLGHWGFQFYAEAAGAHAVDLGRDVLSPGDLLAVPENVSGGGGRALPWDAVTVVEDLSVPSSSGLTLLSGHAGAGFYSSLWGPLPFVFGPVPPERYVVVRVGRPLRGAGDVLAPAR